MNNLRPPNPASRAGKITLMEILVAVAVIVVLIAIGNTVMKSSREKKNLAGATKKLQAIGEALKSYTDDSGGLLPFEDAPGKDDWNTAGKPEATEVWYNALPKRLGASPVADLIDSPEEFYQDSYPLYIKGAPYPKSDKKLSKPYFAFGMNSRLQRKSEDGIKQQGTIAAILKPASTVVFLERGLPKDKKVSKIQGGFDAGAKANPRAFAARHNQKGILLFADGHTEVHALSDLVDKSGRIIFPQDNIVWTPDPDQDPN